MSERIIQQLIASYYNEYIDDVKANNYSESEIFDESFDVLVLIHNSLKMFN